MDLPWKTAIFKRIIDFHLHAWARDPFRKPLLLRGARQVGKTYAVRKLSERFSSFVEVNFERRQELVASLAQGKQKDALTSLINTDSYGR